MATQCDDVFPTIKKVWVSCKVRMDLNERRIIPLRAHAMCFYTNKIGVKQTMLTRAVRKAKALAAFEKAPFGTLRAFLGPFFQIMTYFAVRYH